MVEATDPVFAVEAVDGKLPFQLGGVRMPSAGGLEEAICRVDLMMLVEPTGPMPGGVGVRGRQVMGTVVGVARLRVFQLLQRATQTQPVICDVGGTLAFIASRIGCRLQIAGLQPGLGQGAASSGAVGIEIYAPLER